jgi:hypothetical protein
VLRNVQGFVVQGGYRTGLGNRHGWTVYTNENDYQYIEGYTRSQCRRLTL